ncbi:MAG: D-alanine--D-alanine ligase, partial [Hyphomicrobiales bacterium]|nr:D-alanine--D-alanine ligase [Hyphomicrobiales bacterium]
MGRHVAVLMGGWSVERPVSLNSGNACADALEAEGYRVTRIDVQRDIAERLARLKPDVVFNALHGPGGEDGQVQAILDWMGLPYTGSSVEGAAIAMDKHLTKKLLAAEGLPTPAWDLFDLVGGTLPLLPGSLDLPLVIKPRFEGSSSGVSI